MKKYFIYSLKSKVLYTFLGSFLVLLAWSQSNTVQFKAMDKVTVTADIYASKPATAPFIILFHQAKYSRGEFSEIAPKLNEMGFNCMAVDLRSGGEVNGMENKTFKYADSLGLQTRYIDSYQDMRASISYVKNKYPGAKIILFGSSYSASLSIKLASDFPAGIAGVVAFSPGEYFSKFGWSRDIIEVSASRLKCPVFITSSRDERDRWQKIYDAVPIQTKVSFVPQANGKHGSKALWSAFPESKEYWVALSKFLERY